MRGGIVLAVQGPSGHSCEMEYREAFHNPWDGSCALSGGSASTARGARTCGSHSRRHTTCGRPARVGPSRRIGHPDSSVHPPRWQAHDTWPQARIAMVPARPPAVSRQAASMTSDDAVETVMDNDPYGKYPAGRP